MSIPRPTLTAVVALLVVFVSTSTGRSEASEAQPGHTLGARNVEADDAFAGAPAFTQPTVNDCPVMTDSIRRLYRTFLEREPSDEEFERDAIRYRTGEANLEDLAALLAGSGRFRDRYGQLTNADFVRRIYANTLDREPSDEDLRFWVTTLANGYPRSSVALAFSESEDFVRKTETAIPFSGYLRWYPRGTHWYCGSGPAPFVAIEPLESDEIYADHMFTNWGDTSSQIGMQTIHNGQPHVLISSGSIPAGFSDYRWGGRVVGDGDYGEAIEVAAGTDTDWVVVFYPTPVGSHRAGWQLTR